MIQSTTIGEKIHVTDAEIFRNEYGMLEVVAAPEAEMTVAKLQEANDAMEKMANGEKELILFITHPLGQMTAEARKYPITEQKLRYTLAQAVVVHSMSTLLLANFYVRMKRFPFPYKVFRSREKAIVWLRRQKMKLDEKNIIPEDN